MKYYLVSCRMGHNYNQSFNKVAVGTFSIQAKNSLQAMQKAKYLAGIKHNHTMAIVKLEEVSKETFLKNLKNQPYSKIWVKRQEKNL